MDNIAELITWAAGIQTTLVLGALGFVWNNIHKRISEVKTDLSKKTEDLSSNLGKQINEININLGKRIDDLTQKTDRNEAKFNARLDSKIDPLQHSFNELDKSMAIVGARLSDISTNVNHLMWHSQAIPPKDVNEQ